MLTAALNCIVGQRLVRKAIETEKIPVPALLKPYVTRLEERFTKTLPDEIFPDHTHVYSLEYQEDMRGLYAGRTGIFECVTLNQELKQAILE